ncbi:acyltransferase, WS/DGAT/MGAT [Spizellomyces punctatus DAOM BR117]|uniref:Acyltransferase, WS/DGAT/MGAT n=1 Tax=Spizellomyces punctatus (strain DAOM BR117) TaxID=645134 RepID=A0A0L0H7W0_SPIPD|nr:acyltransferase, WS/DGAT/MGAT [Spizellomyces punctatus DAOM BR117]KNC96778.1 acyltransferase, WS/DGAT/MGAT [Spizellomyces punctatus DAOM BR117]|eukprot:XP_016604818.1 acyltransferase, WS/DGAT/MGAT [Spizellomyces punctatus DAOM BR117]
MADTILDASPFAGEAKCGTSGCPTAWDVEWRFVGLVTLLVAFVGLAHLRLQSKLAIDGGKRRGVPKESPREELEKLQAKCADLASDVRQTIVEEFPSTTTTLKNGVPDVDSEGIEQVELADVGQLMTCYSPSCKDGQTCYSPSCVRGANRIAPTVARVEKPYEVRHPKRERKMSLFSQILSHKCGAFPTKTGIPPTTVHSVFYLEKLPTVTQLKRLLEERILSRYHRFSAIPIESQDGTISWQPYETVDTDAHIIRKTISSESEIKTYVESLFGRMWDVSKPLWFVHLLQNDNNGNSAIVFEIHHVLGDGLSQMQILGDFVTNENGQPLTMDEKKFKKLQSRRPKPSLLSRVWTRTVLFANTGRAFVKVLGLPILRGDSETAVKTAVSRFASSNRILITVPPISLQSIKLIKDKLHVTVNDVLLAALGGAMRMYLQYRSDPNITDPSLRSRVRLRALMPYSFPRPLDDLHNKWTMISAELPVRQPDPLSRVKFAKQTMDAIKSSPEPLVAVQLQQLAYKALGHELSAQTNLDLFARHTCIFTNVPGFQERIYICGQPVLGMQPVVSNALLQVSAVSYDNFIWMNFVVDGETVIQPERLAQYMVREVEELARAAGVSAKILDTKDE